MQRRSGRSWSLVAASMRGEAGHLPRRRWVLTAGLSALALAACTVPSGPSGPDGTPAGRGGSADPPTPDRDAPDQADGEPSAENDSSTTSPQAPVTVSLLSIDLDEELIGLGLLEDGSLEVPQDADRLGWFTGGALPGDAGPTVIAGHVDSQEGPAVFWRLSELVPGDRAEVRSADGGLVTYRVDRVESHAKDAFPTRDVFGGGSQDTLRLITCEGPWVEDEQSYRDNLVVFATALSPQRS